MTHWTPAISAWLHHHQPDQRDPFPALAVDGKSLRGTDTRTGGNTGVYLLAAFWHEISTLRLTEPPIAATAAPNTDAANSNPQSMWRPQFQATVATEEVRPPSAR